MSDSFAFGKYDSWEIINSNIILKVPDLTVYRHNGSGIPAGCRRFWQVESLAYGQRRDIEILYAGVLYDALIQREKRGRTRIFWHTDLGDQIRKHLKSKPEDWPVLRFERLAEARYSLSFLYTASSPAPGTSQGVKMRPLTRYESYSRYDVQQILAPFARFTSQAGTWGLQGIVRIPNTKDYVFFVTLGSKQGNYQFVEGITADGTLSWQSQPKQQLNSKDIKNLIAHDDTVNHIYLFFRTSTDTEYTYLGLLSYLSHDPTRECPVYFTWQILDWDPPTEILEQCSVKNDLLAKNLRISAKRKRLNFSSRQVDFEAISKRNDEIGKAGESIVFELEKAYLVSHGRSDLADKVYITRERDGNNAPYDIHSYFENGQERFVEVKTTTSYTPDEFFISKRERQFYSAHAKQYCLYWIYALDRKTGDYQYLVIEDLDSDCIFSPYTYKAKLK